MNSNNTTVQTNLGCGVFFAALTLVFITLKLTEFIDWTWFWVLSPFIFYIVASVIIVILFLILLIIMVFAGSK